VSTERKRLDGAMALVLFDMLQVRGKSITREPWGDRRKQLEDLFDGRQLPRIGIVAVTDNAARLYETWVGMGGERIVLKDPTSLYRPGERLPAWLKLKPKLARGGRDRRLGDENRLGRLGRGRDARVRIRASPHQRARSISARPFASRAISRSSCESERAPSWSAGA
jgi:hypothetical protein